MQDKRLLKIGAAIGLFVMAGVIFMYSRSTPEVPEDLNAKSYWYCTECKIGFELDNKNSPLDTFKEVKLESAGGDPDKPRRRGTPTTERVAKCPTCTQYTGHAGMVCGSCGAAFQRIKPDGTVLICPECKWDPLTGHEAEGRRLDVLD